MESLDITARARKYAPEMIDELFRIAKSSPSDSARCTAVNLLLERAYGRAVQPIDATVETVDARELSRAELLAIAASAKPDPEPVLMVAPSDETLH